MTTKLIKDLRVGDRLQLEGSGVGEVTAVERAGYIRFSTGPGMLVRWKVIEAGPDSDLGAEGSEMAGANDELHIAEPLG